MRPLTRLPRRVFIALGALAFLGACEAGPAPAPAATVPESARTPTAVPAAQRLVMTYFFYWYDATTGAHLDERAGLRYHPPLVPAASWRSEAWFAKELGDM